MKHWHKCRRWWERSLECPFRGVTDHDDDDGDSEEEFHLIGAKTGSRVVARVGKRTPIGVREFAKGFPLQGTVDVPDVVPTGIPQPIPGGLPDVIGVPFPEDPGVAEIIQRIVLGIGEVPTRWVPTAQELAALMARLQIPVETARQDVVASVAEDAVAAQFGRAMTGEFDLRDLVPAVAVPLLRKLFTRTRTLPMKLPHPVPKPGPMDPVREGSSFRTGAKQEAQAGKPARQRIPRVRQPAPRVGFGGMQINMAERMRELMGVPGRRSFRFFKQSRPEL